MQVAISTGPNQPTNADGLFLPVAQQLLDQPTQRVSPNELVKKGDLITFSYTNWRHDPWPLVVVTDMYLGVMLRGVNLHYLSFPSIKQLLQIKQNNVLIGYKDIIGYKYFTESFRSYKWNGIRQIKKLDVNFLLSVMSLPRVYDANDIKKIREVIQQQIRDRIDPNRSAEAVSEQQTPTIGTTPPQSPQLPQTND